MPFPFVTIINVFVIKFFHVLILNIAHTPDTNMYKHSTIVLSPIQTVRMPIYESQQCISAIVIGLFVCCINLYLKVIIMIAKGLYYIQMSSYFAFRFCIGIEPMCIQDFQGSGHYIVDCVLLQDLNLSSFLFVYTS